MAKSNLTYFVRDIRADGSTGLYRFYDALTGEDLLGTLFVGEEMAPGGWMGTLHRLDPITGEPFETPARVVAHKWRGEHP